MSLLYLAYGSNVHPDRLRRRIPSSLIGTVALPGHALSFHKRGRDGSGKADLVSTGRAADCAHGAVYAISPAAKPLLDACEPGYRAVTLRVMLAGKSQQVFTYRAEPAMIDAALRPFSWYVHLVTAGARHHRFPVDYIAGLLAVPLEEDPDADRHRLHAALVADLLRSSATAAG